MLDEVRDITITIEPLSDALIAELLPLAHKCWNESTIDKGEACAFYGERDMVIEPNLDEYRKLAAIGALVIIVIRCKGIAEGYALGWTYKALHHRHIVGAIGDTFYVEPAFRAYAGVLVDYFLNELKARGVQIIGWPATPGGYVHQVLAARGFVPDDIVMEKRLCA